MIGDDILVTFADRIRASRVLGLAIGEGNAKEWYRNFLYSEIESDYDLKEIVKKYDT